ncbi:MAG: hypothetical protein CMJ40_00545 [Phycisphaerae bacterium]|nr:hypothetical protein [Phycisphaerae bacterium]
MMKWIMFILMLALPLLTSCSDKTEETAKGGIRTSNTRGPVEISVTADRRDLEVGRSLTLVVEAITPDGVSIATPMVNTNGTIGVFNILRSDARSNLPMPGENSGRVWTQSLILDSLQAGDVEIPSFSIEFDDRRAERAVTGTIVTDPLPIEVISLMTASDADGQLRELRGPVNMIDSWPLWTWGLFLLGIIAVIAIGTLFIRGRGLQKITELSPEEQARRDLQNLESSGLLEQQALQPFYFRLTDILRHYIEGRFGLQAPRSTTAEFLNEMGHSRMLTIEQQQTLSQFLRSADMVKFARHEPPAETGHAALQQARFFVDETAPSVDSEGAAA